MFGEESKRTSRIRYLGLEKNISLYTLLLFWLKLFSACFTSAMSPIKKKKKKVSPVLTAMLGDGNALSIYHRIQLASKRHDFLFFGKPNFL